MLRLFLAVLAVTHVSSQICFPEQPFLTLGDDQSSVTFSFVSATDCATPLITLKNIDKSTLQYITLNMSTTYDGQPAGINYKKTGYFFISQIVVGDRYQWSFENAERSIGPFNFKIRDTSKQAKFVLMSDMDITPNSNETVKALKQLDWTQYDGLIHAGDYAYDVNVNDGKRGDDYFNTLWNILPQVPYLVVAGNHENFDKGNLFNYRFRMPGYSKSLTNNFWSKRIGPAFFVFVNYDYYLTFKNNLNDVLSYVETELKKSQQDGIKWRVLVSHRPIYCGEYKTRKDCTINYLVLKPFDELYRKYKIDVNIYGHEHFYERLKTIDKQMNIVKDDAYFNATLKLTDPKDPVQIMGGCAGNIEQVDPNLQLDIFTGKAVLYIQCYSEISISESKFQLILMRSSDNSVLDKTTIHKSRPSSSTQIWVYAIPVAFLFVVVVGYLISRRKSEPTIDASDRSLGYENVETARTDNKI